MGAMARTYAFSVRDVLVLTPPERRRLILSSIGIQEPDGFHNPEAAQKLRRVDRDGRDVRYRLTVVHTVEHARRLMRKAYFNTLVIDEGRNMPGGGALPRAPESLTKTFLVDLQTDHVADPSWRADRTLVLLEEGATFASEVFAAGRLKVGGYASWPLTEESFFEAVAEICRRRAVVGKTALCLAGGGIEGLIYEVGVLEQHA